MKYVNIPTALFKYAELSPTDIIIYGVFNSFDGNEKVCTMTTKELAEMLHQTERNIKKSLANLTKWNLIGCYRKGHSKRFVRYCKTFKSSILYKQYHKEKAEEINNVLDGLRLKWSKK